MTKSVTLKCYIDESGTTKPDRYMVIGGLLVDKTEKPMIAKSVSDYCRDRGLLGEIKWQKTDSGKLIRYREIVDNLRDFNDRREFVYKCLVLDKTRFKHRKYNLGDPTLGYHKFVYQLVLHCFVQYLRQEDKLLVRIDKQSTSYSLPELRNVLNNGSRVRFGFYEHDSVRSVEPRDSRKCRLIQIADLLTGAIRLQINLPIIEKVLPLSDAKRELARYICESFNVQANEVAPPYQNTPFARDYFSIWHFQLRD